MGVCASCIGRFCKEPEPEPNAVASQSTGPGSDLEAMEQQSQPAQEPPTEEQLREFWKPLQKRLQLRGQVINVDEVAQTLQCQDKTSVSRETDKK